MGDGIIDEGGPQKDKDNQGSEANAFDEGPNDKCWCDNGKHSLEGHIGKMRNCRGIGAWPVTDAIQAKPAKSTDQAEADIFPKGQTIAIENPLDTDQGKDH